MHIRILIFLICILFSSDQTFSQTFHTTKDANTQSPKPGQSRFIIGADISELKKVEDNGGIFKVNRVEKDALTILHDHWFEYLRLNLFHTPEAWEKYLQLEANLQMAQRIKQAGFKLLIDLHYSDTWANPGVQTRPKAWQNLSFLVLTDSVYQYTRKIITTFKNKNALPDMVQLGNEITGGMLWDDGRVGGIYNTPTQWQKLAALINAGIQGVKDGLAPGDSVRIMIHLDSGGSKETTQWFFDNLFAHDVNFDIIGLSFYSYWNGKMNNLADNLNSISQKYDKDIIIVETSYPWTLKDYDQVPNWMSDPARLHAGYPASVPGQQSFLEDVITILKNVPNGRGKGIFYWQPIDISPPRCGSGAENIALFDFHGMLLPSIKAFAPPDVARITVHLNTASIPDTLSKNSLFELRGSLNWKAPIILPDGNVLDWSEDSQIEPVHQDGDNYTATFYAPSGSTLRYKFWSQDILQNGLGNGWEIGDSNGDSDGNTVLSLTGDTLLPIHFFNSTESRKSYDWKIWEPENNTIAVWFRVYTHTPEGVQDGYLPKNENVRIGVRGENLNSMGPLNWNMTKVILKRESIAKNSAGFHLFSGVAHYTKSLKGQKQVYKFFIEPNSWEEGNLTEDRSFIIPEQDTTLHWVYYGNTNPISKGPHQITLQLNGSSIPDSIGSDAIFEVRGEINGIAPFTLPDGHILDWSDKSTLRLSNIEGDYYKISFLVPDSAELHFKFWSKDAEKSGLNSGWETGDLNGDMDGNTVLKAITHTTLPLHFFNGTGEKKPYNWRPWQQKKDSVAVWFRVYMNTAEGIKDGYHPASQHQLIGVRGSNLLGWIKTLDWSTTKIALERESSDASGAGFHLFSGVAYYPKLQVLKPTQAYKFIINPNGWEEGTLTTDRTFFVPNRDTTLHWVYYGNTAPRSTDIHILPHRIGLPDKFLLGNSYPNPFNPATVIEYQLPKTASIEISIFNLQGQKVTTLVQDIQHVGYYKTIWNGGDAFGQPVASGIYYYQLKARDPSTNPGQRFLATRKMLLLR